MAGYRWHLIGYALIVGAFFLVLDRLDFFQGPDRRILIVGFVTGLAYSLLPDIDHPNSKVRRFVGKTGLGVVIVSLLAYSFYLKKIEFVYLALVIATFLYLLWFARHRGAYHTPWAGLLLAAPLVFVSPVLAAFALVGYLSHILLDKM